jgi:hypothetical protein
MTRPISAMLAGLTAAVSIAVLGGTGCQSTGVGDPCVPEQEYDPSFLGFSEQEVSIESRSFQCLSRLCLVNHFRGRVSCPYGQTAYNMSAAPKPCSTPIGAMVTGTADGNPISATDPPTATNTTAKDAVMPNCFSRQAVDSVYCSCRCANVNGQTNDGANYCTCPDSYTCTQLVSSTGGANEGLTGAYCVKVGTQFDPGTFVCDPCVPTGTTGHCGSAQGVQGI